jgi:cytochrome c biogenesis protein CcmG/thiol:disulfide interchange protein DsbE
MADVQVETQPDPEPIDEAPRRGRTVLFTALAVAVVLAVLVVVFALAKSGSKDSAKTPLMDEPAPPVVTTTIDGQPFDLSQRRGSWVVLNFFGTWCPPCRQEHPELLRFATGQATQPDGAELVTVVNNDSPDTVRQFFKDNGGNWPVLQDPQGAIYVSFGVSKVPETWIIDPNGYVRYRSIATVTADGLATVLAQLKGQQQ